jgi:hypothetical protein
LNCFHFRDEYLRIKQPGVAKLEKQTDMQLSTLNRVITPLGGKLEVTALFPEGRVKIARP